MLTPRGMVTATLDYERGFNMKRLCVSTLFILAFVLQVAELPSVAGVIFSNLGSPPSYDTAHGWAVCGSCYSGFSVTQAQVFTTSIGGSVTQVDLAVGNELPELTPTFYASIWTDGGGKPGIQIPGARSSLINV